jgi:hypothetical protein
MILFPAFVFAQVDSSNVSKESVPTLDTRKNHSGFGVAVKLSTFGPGIEVIKAFDFPLNLRLGGTYFKDDRDITVYVHSDNATTVNHILLGTLSLMADWQFGSIFHVTLGGIYNFTEETLDVYPNESIYVGEVEVTEETLGYTSTNLKPSKLNPYFGIGFGRSISKNHLVGFGVDLGAAYIGEPKVLLEATGLLAPSAEPFPTQDGGTTSNQEIIANNIKNYKFYPYLNFQLSFRLSGKK